MEYMSMTQAAEELGVTRARVHQLVHAGLLDAEKVGNVYIVSAASVKKRKDNPPQPHRPKAVH